MFFVHCLKKSDFPIPILTSCLQSVIAPKRIERFWRAWCQLLASFKLYMIHVKKSKIDQEKAKIWGVENRPTLSAPHCIGNPIPIYNNIARAWYQLVISSHFWATIKGKSLETPSMQLFSTFPRENLKNLVWFLISSKKSTIWVQSRLCSSNTLEMASKSMEVVIFEFGKKIKLGFPLYLLLLLCVKRLIFFTLQRDKFVSFLIYRNKSKIWA